jgi:hypothetical protein
MNIFGKIAGYVQGRHTLFALFFTGMGTVLAWRGKLDPNFVALAATMQGWVFVHSYKEDRFNSSQGPTIGGPVPSAPDIQGS